MHCLYFSDVSESERDRERETKSDLVPSCSFCLSPPLTQTPKSPCPNLREFPADASSLASSLTFISTVSCPRGHQCALCFEPSSCFLIPVLFCFVFYSLLELCYVDTPHSSKLLALMATLPQSVDGPWVSLCSSWSVGVSRSLLCPSRWR